MEQWDYRAYGDGWIRFSPPAPTDTSIARLLDAIRDTPLQDQMTLGPAGDPPAYLTAVDGETRIPLSPQLTEFYTYARWWRESTVLDQVVDPDDFLDHLTDPRIALLDLLKNEFSWPYVLVDQDGDGVDPRRCVLFSLDTVEHSPYSRIYLVFDPPENSRTEGHTPGEPEVWGFSGDHFHSPDLRSFLINTM